MTRSDIISKVGKDFLTSNIEKEEFSYNKALKSKGKNIRDYRNNNGSTMHQNIDIRFENDRLSILVETKNNFDKWNHQDIRQQLQDYVRYEKEYTDKKIVAILAETEGNRVWTWYGGSVIIDEAHRRTNERVLKTFEEYENICFGRVNNKIKVVDSIKQLNELLHSNNINASLRSQFVGTCLLAIKNGLNFENVKETVDRETGAIMSKVQVIIRNITDILSGLLARDFEENDEPEATLNKAEKIAALNRKVLEDQDVQNLHYEDFKQILSFININILPYIDDSNTAGQDLLNLFFTTFNKYVGKSDKNQAFTPDHICDFMSKAIGVNKNSIVLDPCCGSGAFLVRAMTDAMDDCDDEQERENVKKHQIYGIEYEDGAFGLSSTNMLIHGDGNSNVVKDTMFNRGNWIKEKNINVVLMNPPYNANKTQSEPNFVTTWSSSSTTDPSKGFHYIEWIANHVSNNCKMAVLLPMQCAIGNNTTIKSFKQKMLEKYTLDAVFSLPDEMFYPGASACACCMIFDLSRRHERTNRDTFFGYFKDDKFTKRKGLGRVERTDENGNSLWVSTEEQWLDLYKNRRTEPGLSVTKKVTANDEWLAEAYMETDYNTLKEEDFQNTINNYLSYLVKRGDVHE